MSDFRIRPSTPEDVPEIFGMIYELAEYENSAPEVQSIEELLHASLFADDPAVWCSILEHTDGDAASDDWAIAGFCIWFKNSFTWTAKHSMGRSRSRCRVVAQGHLGSGVLDTTDLKGPPCAISVIGS